MEVPQLAPHRDTRRIGGPLEVEYVELVAWFYPKVGDGVMILTRRREDGTDATLNTERRIEHALGPFDADIWVPRMAHSWVSAVRRMTNWATLDHVSGADSPLPGDD